MWVLSPMISTASQQAAEASALPNPVHFLLSGSITIGRPAKKGGTTGKADLLIFGESSVSSVHAVLTVEQGENGEHGAVNITDDSKYGTFVQQQQGLQEQRIPAKQPFPLHLGNILRFGTKCRYRLQQVPLNICLTATAAADPDLAAAAARCNAGLVDTCSTGAGTHCIVSEGDLLTPAALYSLITQHKLPLEKQIQLVTTEWLTAVAAGKAFANQLPDTEPYIPRQLQLPRLQEQQQQQHDVLDVLNWRMPAGNLMAEYRLILPQERQPDLAQAAQHICPEIFLKSRPLSNSDLAAEAQQAAGIGKTAVLVLPDSSSAANTYTAAPVISERQLLSVLATGEVAPIHSTVDAFNHHHQQQTKAAATAQAQAAAAPAEDSEDLTEAEETDAGADDVIDEGQLQAVTPVVHGRQQQQRTPGKKGKSPAKQPLQLQASTPRSSRANKRGAAAMEAALPAAPAAAAAAARSPQGRKRRKTTAAAAAVDDDLEFAEDSIQQQPLQQSAAAAAAGAWHSGNAPAAAAAAAQQPQQQQQQPGAVAGPSAAAGPSANPPPAVAGLQQLQEGIYLAPLVVVQPTSAAAAAPPAQRPADDSTAPVVNFKAFRRKQPLPGYLASGQQQQGSGQQPQQQQQQQPPAAVVPVVPYDAAPKGLDVDNFLKEERARLERLKKADELFNANLKPKAVAKSTGAAAGIPRPPAKRKAR